MDITLRPMTREERIYSYTQSSQIGSQTGNIGHLRADMDSGGESFFFTWFDFRKDLKTEGFKAELDDVINHFRFSDVPGGDFLKKAEAAYRTDILSLRPMTEEERRLIQISFSCLQNRLKEYNI